MHGNENTDEALEIAGHLAINLGIPTALGRREKDREVLARFEGFRFGFRGNRQAWAVGHGPQVVLVHGYNGMAAQMAPIARDLEMNGYRAILFDAGGHGESASHRVGFDTFIEDTRSILEEIGPVHALIGHSAGGHLALMLASRKTGNPLPLRGVVTLAGITDLRKTGTACDKEVIQFAGGEAKEKTAVYDQASPIQLLPLGVKQKIIQGDADTIIPMAMATDYVEAAKKKNDPAELIALKEADHFQLVDPKSAAWPAVLEAAKSLLK